MDQSEINQDELQRRRLQEYIFGLEEIREKAEDLATEHEKLKYTQDLLMAILSATTHGICLVKDGKVVWCNKGMTNIFGWELDELVGKRGDILFPGAEGCSNPDEWLFGDSCKNGMIESEYDLVSKGGEKVPCLATRRPLDENDFSRGCIFSFTDFRERKKAEEALQKAHDELEKRVEERTEELARTNERLKKELAERKWGEEERKRLQSQLVQAQKLEAIGTLAGGIAHDFNNLLMGIQGNVSLMLTRFDPSHPHLERLRNVEKLVDSGSRLTRQLLGYARKGKYDVGPMDLNQLLEVTSDTFGRIRKDITISKEFGNNLRPIQADYGQIEQVLMNLLVNAGDAMPAGGSLFLKTVNVTHEDMTEKVYDPKPGKYVLLIVRDTGVGMDKKTQANIFDPFFTTKEMGRGTGLGLASVYGIIKGHAGYIDLESEKGKGTTFKVYLPATGEAVREEIGATDEVIKGTETVLLVDDEKIILDLGREMLESMGYHVLIAGGGEEAVDAFRKHQKSIDLVILDIVMPRMSGREVYDRLKEINPEIKVLIYSGYSIDGQAAKILEKGCDGFIQKPFDMEKLSKKIREILAGA